MKAVVLCFSLAAILSFTACGNKRNSTVAVNRAGQQVDNSGGFSKALYNEIPKTGTPGGAYQYLQSDRLALHEEGSDKRVYVQFKLVLRTQTTTKTKVAQKQFHLFYDEYLTCNDGVSPTLANGQPDLNKQRIFHTAVIDNWVGGRNQITLNNYGKVEKGGTKADPTFLITFSKYLDEQDNFLTITNPQGKIVPASWALTIKGSDTSVDKLSAASYPQTAKAALISQYDTKSICANVKTNDAKTFATDGEGNLLPNSVVAPLSHFLQAPTLQDGSLVDPKGP